MSQPAPRYIVGTGIEPLGALSDEQIDAIAEAQDDEGWFVSRLTKLEWRAFARAVLAAAGVSASDGQVKSDQPPMRTPKE